MIESGPAAGVLAAAYSGQLTDNHNLISFDMGGTTAKAGLIEQADSTIVIHPGQHADIDRFGNVIVELPGEREA